MPGNNRVIWSEGMFLRPHHFQQQNRYLERFIDQRCGNLRPFGWGFSELQLDQKLLGLGKVAILQASGVFPDGTPFDIPAENEPPLAVDIPDSVKEAEIFLCLPLRRAGTREVEEGVDADSLSRYTATESEVQDNSTLGGGTASVQVGELRLRILQADHHRDEYACMGLCRVVEVRPDKRLALDQDYLPPLLDCQAAAVMKGFLKELVGLLGHRAEALAGRVAVSGRGGAAEVQDFLLLQVVNRYQPLLAHLAGLACYHPESFYRLGLSMAGELATFVSQDKRAPQFPPYRHEDLKATFAPLMQSLREALSMVVESSALPIPLQERRYGIRVATLSDRSLLDQAMFVLAVAADLPTEDIRKRFPAQVKIGPVEEIRQLVNVQLPGIRVRPLPVAPRQIPFHTGFVYFELDRSGELWQRLRTSGGFALHLGGEFPGIQMEFWAIRSG